MIALLLIGTAAASIIAATALLGAREPATAPSPEVRALARIDGDCGFRRLSIVHRQIAPVPPSQWRQTPDCGYIEHEDLRIERFEHQGPHGSYRLEFTKRPNERPTPFIIYLTGGPRSMTTGVGPGPLRLQLPVRLAEQYATAVVAPAYLGTWTRSLYPATDTEAAAEEVASLIERLRSLHPRARLAVVAESAAALVAMRLLLRQSVPTVLLSPSPTGLRELVTDPRGTDLASDARSHRIRFNRYRPGTQEIEAVTATAEEQVAAFAGDDYDRSLADMIRRRPPQRRDCLAIVHGTADRRVRVSRFSEVRSAVPSMTIYAIEGMGHGPSSEEQAGALASAVRRVMPEHCS